MNDADERVERTDVGASIEVSITRGTGTRDQEKYRIKGKGADAAQALGEFEEMLADVEEEYAERIRALQPDEVDADE